MGAIEVLLGARAEVPALQPAGNPVQHPYNVNITSGRVDLPLLLQLDQELLPGPQERRVPDVELGVGPPELEDGD